MKTPKNYSILSDNYALFEIRKHKWIQSEKAGQEIGFPSAAVEWIKNYGDSWKHYRFSKLFQATKHMEQNRDSFRS